MNMQTWLLCGLGTKILLVEFFSTRERGFLLVFQVLLHPVRTSLVQSLQGRLSHKVDVLIFNPPYVPTDELEATSAQEAQDISGAWAGGTDGMYLTNVLLKQVDVSYDFSSHSFRNLPYHRDHRRLMAVILTCSIR